ncbi:Zinc finger RNA-binding protein-like 1 [Homarus americanus]|uniref:Zinc finger RNA-binding protein-like 1 n=1 Tax=Homarus americanus TaxID=6706 RepID=A0A8J5MW45_HOMAM|nr:Zinc finger RNA-binding protein-like 1 [Homarus americanus]
MLHWEDRRRYEEECEYHDWCRCYPRGLLGPPPMMPPGMPRPPGMPPMMPMRRPDSSDDRHVLAKHAEIYPKEEELWAIQKIVSNTKKALKMVSDYLAEVDAPKEQQVMPKAKKDVKEEDPKGDDDKKDGEKKEDGPPRMLKCVMRVGILAKGLLLRGDTSVQLVVLCGDKPTRTLLDRVADNLPKQLAVVAPEDKYEIQRVVEEAALVVQNIGEQRISVNVTLTSPIMREQLLHDGDSQVTAAKDPPDALDKQKCLDALAAINHATWFQHALRLIASRQIHKVLGMDPFPPPKFQRGGRFTNKRKRDNSTSEGNDSEAYYQIPHPTPVPSTVTTSPHTSPHHHYYLTPHQSPPPLLPHPTPDPTTITTSPHTSPHHHYYLTPPPPHTSPHHHYYLTPHQSPPPLLPHLTPVPTTITASPHTSPHHHYCMSSTHENVNKNDNQ